MLCVVWVPACSCAGSAARREQHGVVRELAVQNLKIPRQPHCLRQGRDLKFDAQAYAISIQIESLHVVCTACGVDAFQLLMGTRSCRHRVHARRSHQSARSGSATSIIRQISCELLQGAFRLCLLPLWFGSRQCVSTYSALMYSDLVLPCNELRTFAGSAHAFAAMHWAGTTSVLWMQCVRTRCGPSRSQSYTKATQSNSRAPSSKAT